MKYSKLLELLLGFSKKELSELLEISIANGNKLIKRDLEILKFIMPIIHHSKKGQLDEQQLEQTVFSKFLVMESPKKQKAEWNYTKNRLTEFINYFIVTRQLNKHYLMKDYLLLKHYQARGLEKNFSTFLKRTQKNLKKSEQDFDKAFYKYKLQEIILFQKMGQRVIMEELAKMNEALDDFYLENKFRILIEQYNRNRIINTEPPDDFFLEVVKANIIPANKLAHQLFYHIHLMMTAPQNLDHYFSVKQEFYQNSINYSGDYQRTVSDYLLNQCVFYHRNGNTDFAREYVELVKFLSDHQLLLNERTLSFNRYANTVLMALISNNLKWAEHFVVEYSDFVEHENTESIKNLNLANISFFKGDIANAWKYLINYNSKELYVKILYDKLCIKLYFETKEERLLTSKLNAFKQYVVRNSRLSDERKSKNLNFISATSALFKNGKLPKGIKKNDYLFLDYLWLAKKIKGE